MIAFDTDVLSEIVRGQPSYVARAAVIPQDSQCIPVVVAEEALRGRLNTIRQADAAKVRATLEHAYALFAATIRVTGTFRLLHYTAAADAQFAEWRAEKVRIGTQDLRIAAICIVHDAKLVTRNARDYAQVPGLKLEVWT